MCKVVRHDVTHAGFDQDTVRLFMGHDDYELSVCVCVYAHACVCVCVCFWVGGCLDVHSTHPKVGAGLQEVALLFLGTGE